MTKWKAAQASVPVSQRIMVLTDGARFLKHFVMMGTQQLCLRALFCFQPFPQPCLNQHKNLVKQQLAFDFSEIVCLVGEGYKSPMDPEMNMKS